MRKEFRESRCLFAEVNGDIYISENEERSHAEWLKDELGVEDIQGIVRGYIKDNKIIFYVKQDGEFDSVPVGKVRRLLPLLNKKGIPAYKSKCYSGIAVGKPTEEWKPMYRVVL